MRALGSIATNGSQQLFALAPLRGERVRVRGPRAIAAPFPSPAGLPAGGLSPPSGARRRSDHSKPSNFVGIPRGFGRGVCLTAAFFLLAAAGCEEVSHRDIGDEINILVRRDDALVGPATDRLARYRRSAIPQIETAMHTAAPAGRHHLIAALEKIGDGEAVPILRHVAVFDITADVRAAAENLLSRWAAATDGSRAPRAPRPRWPRSRASAPPGSGR